MRIKMLNAVGKYAEMCRSSGLMQGRVSDGAW